MTPSVMYNFDASSLTLKILSDIATSQLPSGLVPDIAPEYVVFSGGFRDSPEWGSALLQLPGSLLDFFGPDVAGEGIKQHYGAMVDYVHYLMSQRDGRGLLAYGLGDWCDANSKHGCDPPGQLTPLGVTGTCMLFSNCALLSRFASTILHNASEAEVWASAAHTVRADYLASPLWPPAAGSQTSPAMPLAMGLLNSSALQQAALDALISDIKSRDYHQTGGDIGHRFILNALGQSAAGNDVVARITNSTDFPSYGAMLVSGVTSLPEQWDGSGSQLHSMLGHVDEWFYRYVLGFTPPYAVPSPSSPVLLLAPQPVSGLDWARGHWRDVHIHWQWLVDTPSLHVLRIHVSVPIAASFPVRVRAPLRAASRPRALFEGACDPTAISSNNINSPSTASSSMIIGCIGGCNVMTSDCDGLRLMANGDVAVDSGEWMLSVVYAADDAL